MIASPSASVVLLDLTCLKYSNPHPIVHLGIYVGGQLWSGSTIKTRLNIFADPALQQNISRHRFARCDTGQWGFLSLASTSNQFVALCSPILAKSTLFRSPSHPYSHLHSCRVMALKLKKGLYFKVIFEYKQYYSWTFIITNFSQKRNVCF